MKHAAVASPARASHAPGTPLGGAQAASAGRALGRSGAGRQLEQRRLKLRALGRVHGNLSGGQGGGGRILAAAESQLGQSEQPPGSNESPAIAEYRARDRGRRLRASRGARTSSPGRRARRASRSAPAGEGLGSVSAIWSWAQSAGRAVANGPGRRAAAGRSDRLRRRARRDRAGSAAGRAHRDDRGQLRKQGVCERPQRRRSDRLRAA